MPVPSISAVPLTGICWGGARSIHGARAVCPTQTGVRNGTNSLAAAPQVVCSMLGTQTVARDGSSSASTSGRDVQSGVSKCRIHAGLQHRFQHGPSARIHGQHSRHDRSTRPRCSAAETAAAASSRLSIEDLGFQSQHADDGDDPMQAHGMQSGSSNGKAWARAGAGQKAHMAEQDSGTWQQEQQHRQGPGQRKRQRAVNGQVSNGQPVSNGHAVAGSLQGAELDQPLQHLLRLHASNGVSLDLQDAQGLLFDAADMDGALHDAAASDQDQAALLAQQAWQQTHGSAASQQDTMSAESGYHSAASEGHVPTLHIRQMSLDEAKMFTASMTRCTSWHDLCSLLLRCADDSGAASLLPAASAASSPLTAAIASPQVLSHMLQHLNDRHVAVMWLTLARLVPDTDADHSSSQQHQGADHGSPAQQSASHPPSHSHSQHPGSQHQPATPRSALSRADSLVLSRLLTALEQRSQQCMAVTGAWDARDVANVAWAMGRLGCSPSQRWVSQFVTGSQPQLHAMEPRHVAMMVWGLGCMDVHPGAAWLSDVRALSLQCVSRRRFTSQGAAMVLWGMARMQQAHQRGVAANTLLEWLVPYVSHTTVLLQQGSPQHVSMAMWAVGALAEGGVAASTSQSYVQAVTQLLSVATASGTALGPQGVANCLWAVAQTGLVTAPRHSRHSAHAPAVTPTPVRALDSCDGSSEDSCASTPGCDEGWTFLPASSPRPALPAALQLLESSQPLLPAMSAQQLANCAWAAAAMQARPPSSWVRALLAAVRERLADMEPRGLACVLWACCRMGVRPGPGWMSAFMEVVEERLGSFCGRSLPQLLWSLAGLGYSPGAAWCKAAFAASGRLLPSFTPGALASCAMSLSRLGAAPPPTWASTLLAASRQHLLATAGRSSSHSSDHLDERHSHALSQQAVHPVRSTPFAAMELPALLQGAARLGMSPSHSWLEAAEAAVLATVTAAGSSNGRPSQLGLRQLAGSLYGLARLRHAASEPLLASAAAMLLREAASQPPSQLLALDTAQLLWSLAMMGYAPPPSQLDAFVQLSQQHMSAMGAAELAQCVWALQRMGARPPHAWLSQLAVTAEPLLPHMSLLSVATVLRAMLHWGAQGPPEWSQHAAAAAAVTVAPAAAMSQPLPLSAAWLQAAAAAVEAGASGAANGASGGYAPSRHGTVPFAVVAARSALLSAAGTTMGRGTAMRRLAVVERLPGRQRAKVAEAAMRALACFGHPDYQDILAASSSLSHHSGGDDSAPTGSGSRGGEGEWEEGEVGAPVLGWRDSGSSLAVGLSGSSGLRAGSNSADSSDASSSPQRPAQQPARSTGGAAAGGGAGAVAGAPRRGRAGSSSSGGAGSNVSGGASLGPDRASYDGLYADHDLRYMPW